MRIIFFFALLLSFPACAVAITLDLPGIGNPLIIGVEPADIIEPHSTVTLTAQSYALDLDRSTIAWIVNGKHDSSGDNNKTFTVKVGDIGTETKVTLLVGGTSLTSQADITVRPTELELLWEADGYTPPLYRGRALPTPGTNIITQAQTHFVRPGGAVVDQKDIVYIWSLDNRRLATLSGRGKSSAKIPLTELFGDAIVSVTASSLDGAFSATRSVRVPRVEPLLELYRQHPLLGIDYRGAFGHSNSFGDAEVTVAAFPYFVRATSPADAALSYEWQVDGKNVAVDAAKPFLLTLSLVDKTFGSTVVNTTIFDAVNVLQSASGQWAVTLSGNQSTKATSPFPIQ